MSWDALAAWTVDEARAGTACAIASSRRRGAEPWERRVGAAGRLDGEPGAPPASVATRFDLASVTKPVTALLAARLVRAGRIGWGTTLREVLPEARACAAGDATLELLLAHRAGLEAHRPLFAPLLEGRPVERAAAVLVAASALRAGCAGAPPAEGFAPLYSDLGYLLAGEMLARAGGAPLDDLVATAVLAPLGLDARIGSARRLGESRDVAATEVVAWRGGAVRGRVHDENAWALAGAGACGHAGLFGDATAVLALGEAIASALAGERAAWLATRELEPLIAPRPGGTLRAGFDGKSAEGSSAGAAFGPRSFGHLGFTGTSLWIDPDRPLVAVLLTNRVHPTRANDAIRRVRPRVHDAVAAWADA